MDDDVGKFVHSVAVVELACHLRAALSSWESHSRRPTFTAPHSWPGPTSRRCPFMKTMAPCIATTDRRGRECHRDPQRSRHQLVSPAAVRESAVSKQFQRRQRPVRRAGLGLHDRTGPARESRRAARCCSTFTTPTRGPTRATSGSQTPGDRSTMPATTTAGVRLHQANHRGVQDRERPAGHGANRQRNRQRTAVEQRVRANDDNSTVGGANTGYPWTGGSHATGFRPAGDAALRRDPRCPRRRRSGR